MKMDNETSKTIKAERDTEISIYQNDFVEFVHMRFGIDMSHRLDDLYKAINKACDLFHYSPNNYLKELRKAHDHSLIIEQLINNITIGETYFFRDQKQMNLLTERILPDIIENKKREQNHHLRIWSAGVSSGEEIYTLAMILNEKFSDTAHWTVSLLGTDINTLQLNKAISGEYTEWSMRSIDDYYKNKYFKKINNKFYLSRDIIDKVTFYYLNLNDNTYPSIFNGTNAQDLILCRNVLIYFDSSRIKQVMHQFTQSLNADGYLILGASDPVHISDTHLKLFTPTVYQLFKRDEMKSQFSSGDEKISTLHETTHPIHGESETKQNDLTHLSLMKHEEIEKEIEELLSQCEWQKVLKLIALQELLEHKSLSLMRAKALALASIGELRLSLKICEECIASFPADKYIYFTYALIQQECHDFSAAEQSLKKVIYLDHAFVVAHFQLGLLQLRHHHDEMGIKSLRNALTLAKNHSEQEKVPAAMNVTYGQLAEILKNELEIYTQESIQGGTDGY